MRTLIAVLIFSAPFTATAADLRKCVAKDGQSVYVTGPCTSGTDPAWSRRVEPEKVVPAKPAVVADEPMEYRSPAGPFVPVRSPSPEKQKRAAALARCEGAKQWRIDQEGRAGIRRTHDMLRRWDEHVARQCKSD
jgi:hypothetical protein